MPWTALSGNVYNLCLLDTNALSEILKDINGEAIGFMKKCPPENTVPCMTVYNYIELRRNPELFEEYLKVFSIYSNFLLKPHRILISDEVDSVNSSTPVSVYFRAFSYLGPKSTHDLCTFINLLFEVPDIAHIENNWRDEEKTAIESWLKRKSSFTSANPVANSADGERYVREMILNFLENDRQLSVKEKIASAKNVIMDNYPSIQTMLYSEYYRIFEPNWEPQLQDVTDTYIIASAPYVDIVITERFQAEILRKIRNRVTGLDKLEILTLRDIRCN